MPLAPPPWPRGPPLSQNALRRLAVAASVSAAAAAAVVLFVFDPATAWFFPPCLFRALTGHPCPGCGTLRAFHALLHGDVAGALRLNALTVIGLPLAVAQLGVRSIILNSRRNSKL